MSAFLSVVVEFLKVVGLTAGLTAVALTFGVLMLPNRPTVQDLEVGIELIIASLGLALGTLLTEATAYGLALAITGLILVFLAAAAAAFTKGFGYDSQGRLKPKAVVVLDILGLVALIVTYAVSVNAETISGWSHASSG